MSLSQPSSRSIAARLVWLFTIAAVLLLAAGLGLLYWIVVQHGYEEDNEVLADKALALRADLESAVGPAALREELKVLRASERVAYFVRIIDSEGNIAAETPDMSSLLPPAAFPPPIESPDRPKSYRSGQHLFACLATKQDAGGETYTIQVAQDRSSDEQSTGRFASIVVAVIGAGIIASALIAKTIVRQGLQPLADMTRELDRVRVTRLHQRVPVAGWPRELQPLVVAFDEMLNRLEDSFTRLSQFSADLAHELRTPIAILHGEAEVALRRERSPNEYREVIESSVAECQRLSGIIDTLLFLARAEAADRSVQRTTFDGYPAIAKVADYYRTIAEDRGITIDCLGEGRICADAALFDRALSNLIDNALRHTPDGGQIEVSITQRDHEAEVRVHDNGRGIAREHLSRVFDRFYRADSSRSSAGTGLGLALVKSIATLHGGTANIESEEGNGTTVTITFCDLRETTEMIPLVEAASRISKV